MGEFLVATLLGGGLVLVGVIFGYGVGTADRKKESD